MRRLFVCIRKLDQQGFGPRAAENGYACGKGSASRKSHGNIDRGESGGGRIELAVVAGGRVQIADQTRRIAPRWIYKSIKFQCVHGLVHRGANLVAIHGIGFAGGRIGSVFGALFCLFQATLRGGMEAV